MNILITGAFGFIGARLVPLLSSNSNRLWLCGRSIDNVSESSSTSKIVIGNLQPSLFNDISDIEFDWIINCCGSSSVYGSTVAPHADFDSNVSSTSILIDFLIRSNIRAHFIQFSSAAIYGDHNIDKLTLGTTPNPLSPYAVHNLMAENLLQYHFKVGNFRSLHILRLFSIYGNLLRKRLLWDACNKLHQTQSPTPVSFYGSGNEKRDWTHVDDVCQLVQMILEQDHHSLLYYNVGTGVSTTNKCLITSISALLQSSVPFTFNSMVPPYDPFSLVACTKDNPIPFNCSYNLDSGLEEYVQWFKAQQL